MGAFVTIVVLYIIAMIVFGVFANSKKAKELERNHINDTVKKSFNMDFNATLYIEDVFAIDKTRNIIFLTYEKNTISYLAWIRSSAIIDYSLEQEYKEKSLVKRTVVGGLIGGGLGAAVGAASSVGDTPTGNYVLHIEFKLNNAWNETNILCTRENGQEIIRCLNDMCS